MTHVTCSLTAKNRDQLRNPTLGGLPLPFISIGDAGPVADPGIGGRRLIHPLASSPFLPLLSLPVLHSGAVIEYRLPITFLFSCLIMSGLFAVRLQEIATAARSVTRVFSIPTVCARTCASGVNIASSWYSTTPTTGNGIARTTSQSVCSSDPPWRHRANTTENCRQNGNASTTVRRRRGEAEAGAELRCNRKWKSSRAERRRR